jgi:hypothetical protein
MYKLPLALLEASGAMLRVKLSAMSYGRRAFEGRGGLYGSKRWLDVLRRARVRRGMMEPEKKR